VELDVDDVPLGAVSVKVNGTDSQPGDDVRSPLRDLVVRCASLGTPECIDPSNAILGTESSGVGGWKITRLLMSGPPDSSPPSINWR
jgi:hypothetical protein